MTGWLCQIWGFIEFISNGWLDWLFLTGMTRFPGAMFECREGWLI